MNAKTNTFHKITAVLAVLIPILYVSMYLPIWNFHTYGIPINIFTKISLPEIIFQSLCFVIAGIRAFSIFRWKNSRFNSVFGFVFYPLMFLSGILLMFYGIFFAEGLLGIPVFPMQK